MDKSQPAIGISAGYLSEDVDFVGSLDGTVKGYRAADGEVVAEFQVPAGIGSAINVSGDTLYAAAGVPATFGGLPETNGLYAYKADLSAAEPATRVGGDDPVATAVSVSQTSFSDPAAVNAVVLASSEAFPDALTGTPLAAQLGGPLLLTPGGELSPAVADEIRRLL